MEVPQIVFKEEPEDSHAKESKPNRHLLSMENIDRASPDLWPETIPGLNEFAATHNLVAEASSSKSDKKELDNYDKEDLALLHRFSQMDPSQFVNEFKKLQSVAFNLSQDEAKEIQRGRILKIIPSNPN